MDTVNPNPEEQAKENHKRKVPPYWYTFLITIIALLVIAVAGVVYTNHVDQARAKDERENDRQWCDLVVFYTDYYREHPPVTELQSKQYGLMEMRRIQLGCK